MALFILPIPIGSIQFIHLSEHSIARLECVASTPCVQPTTRLLLTSLCAVVLMCRQYSTEQPFLLPNMLSWTTTGW